MKRSLASLQVVGSDEEIESEDEERPSRGNRSTIHASSSFQQNAHNDPGKVQALGRYLEACGGSGKLVQSWTCVVKTKKTTGESWVMFYDEQNRPFRSRASVARHFGLKPPTQPQKESAERKPRAASSSSTALAIRSDPLDAPFTEADAANMTVVWATLKGYPPWPAEVMRTSGHRFIVRFFATDNEATLDTSALKRYHKKQHTLRQGKGGRVASAQLHAAFFEAVKLADSALGEAPPDPTAEDPPTTTNNMDMDMDMDTSIEKTTREHEEAVPGAIAVARGAAAATAAASPAASKGVERGVALAASPAALQHATTPRPTAVAAMSDLGGLDGTDAMRAVLVEMRLESYASAFEADGWDDLPYLVGLDEERRKEIGVSVGMKPGHAMKFSTMLLQVVERLHGMRTKVGTEGSTPGTGAT